MNFPSRAEVKERIKKLREAINHYRHAYHVLNKSLISDEALDSLKHELYKLEQQWPEFITSDSPTQRVAGKPLEEFKKIHHQFPIISIEDVFSFEELKEWEDYVLKFTPLEIQPNPSSDDLSKAKPPYGSHSTITTSNFKSLTGFTPLHKKLDYFCELKVDGIDIVLTYEEGMLKTAATRGDGKIGEDVTQNIKTVEAIPLKLQKFEIRNSKFEIPPRLVVRGEIFISKKDFAKINEEQKKNNLPVFANQRNLTAGSVRQLDSKIPAQRRLDCYVFEILTDLGQKTHQEVHQTLKSLGFKTDERAKYVGGLKGVEEFHNQWYKNRSKVPFDYDGIVAVINDIKIERLLGTVGKSPRWMRAYKFPAEQATSVVKDIIVQVGRTGVLTPVAILEPVKVMGSTVSRATLHNDDEIKRLDVRIGDTVIIQKAGDVIPDIVKVLKDLRTGREKFFKMPNKCQICLSPVVKREDEVAYYCSNKKCFARQHAEIVHFVSRKGFNIDGLGDKIVEHLINEGLIKNAADLFNLTIGDLEPVERFAEKSATNLVEAIQKSKKIELAKFIYALGIRHVGEETAIDLASHFGKIEKLQSASLEEFLKIKDVGQKMGQSLYDWFHQSANVDLIKKFLQAGIKITSLREPKTAKKSSLFANKNIVLTGALKSMSREAVKEKLRNLGVDISESVSSKTDLVIVGEEPGSKYERAVKLGIRVIKEKEFLEMMKYKR